LILDLVLVSSMSDLKHSQSDEEYLEEDSNQFFEVNAAAKSELEGEIDDRSDSKTDSRNSRNPPPMKGLGLDLARAGVTSTRSSGTQENDILVIFDLPDGSQGESSFKLGQTVEVLKSFVESEYHIPMCEQTLFIEDKMMLDPLSLMDYPETKGNPV
jgi:hypothetical protein